VLADRIQIQQVLSNLLRNGIEAMDSVTDRPRRLAIASWLEDGEIIVRVTDNGVGFENDDIFESFYSTKAQGLGVGLAICRSVIDAHGGRIWGARNSLHGSTFGFALRVESKVG
jgi:C4-dicarboxylate-specific signal transduction histidine kinase